MRQTHGCHHVTTDEKALGWAGQSGSLPGGKGNSCNFYVATTWNSLLWFLEFLEFMDRSGFEGLEPSAQEALGGRSRGLSQCVRSVLCFHLPWKILFEKLIP